MRHRDVTGFDPDEFPLLLKRLREGRGISMTDLAGMIDAHHSYISRLEGGQRSPGRDMVYRLANALMLHGSDRVDFAKAAGYWMPTGCTHCDGSGVAYLAPVPCEECGTDRERPAPGSLAAFGAALAQINRLAEGVSRERLTHPDPMRRSWGSATNPYVGDPKARLADPERGYGVYVSRDHSDDEGSS